MHHQGSASSPGKRLWQNTLCAGGEMAHPGFIRVRHCAHGNRFVALPQQYEYPSPMLRSHPGSSLLQGAMQNAKKALSMWWFAYLLGWPRWHWQCVLRWVVS